MTAAKKRIAVLISGRGSNMQALVEAAKSPDYPAEITTVISNRPDAAGVAWAGNNDVPTSIVDHKAYPSREDFEAELQSVLDAQGIEFVALGGFMRLMTQPFIEHWQGRMLNIHPALLPLFKGLHPHAQALKAGVKISGCTVHFVTPEMDSGPIIAQAAVPIVPNDTPETLAARILTAEHQIYPKALAWLATGAVTFDTASSGIYGTVNQEARLIVPE